MKVVAQQGDEVFLVQTEGEMGQVVNIVSKLAFVPTYIQAILKHGYWETPTATKADQDAAVALAQG